MLHILDSALDFQTRRIAEEVLRAIGPEMRIEQRMIGPGGNDRGIAEGIFRLRTERRGLDLVHTFGRRALIAAALTWRGPMVHTLAAEASDAEIRWLRAIGGYRPIRVVCASDGDMRRAVRAGVSPAGCALIHPGVDFSRLKQKRDANLREELGFGDADYVILAAGESTPHARHELALWTCGILSEFNVNYRLLLWGRGPRARRLGERSRPWRQPGMARFAELVLKRSVEYEALLAVADLVLVTGGDGAATLPIALSMAAGLPIVSVVNRGTSELLEDRHTAAMVGSEKPRDLATRILEVRQDSALQWHIADRARAEAYEHFPLSKSMQRWREIYEEMKAGASATLTKPNVR